MLHFWYLKLYAPYEDNAVELSKLGVEVWTSLDELYFVSNLGNLTSAKAVRVKKRVTNGYNSVFLRSRGKCYVGRLVVESFLSPVGKWRLMHLGDKRDDRLHVLGYTAILDFEKLRTLA